MKKMIKAVCIAVIIAVQTVFCITAHAADNAAGSDIVRELFALNISERGVDNFYDGLQLGSADWTVICRARLYGAENSSEFVESALRSAEELINSDSFVTPTELQRTAIVLAAFGECPRELINAAAYCNTDLDRQGLNAWIWALTAANCSGIEPDNSAVYTRLQFAEEIIGRQLADGGFALRGSSADADITAAAITALAPLADNENICKALDRAVSVLSNLQQENGGFLSLGSETSESTAQAVVAFTAAGIDDERLDNAVSALLRFRREDGGFAHELGGKTNKMATVQALQAFAALSLKERGELLFDKPKNNAQEQPNTGESCESVSVDTSEEFSEIIPETEETRPAITGFHIKLMISALIGVIGIAVLIIAAVKRGKRFAVSGIILLILSGAVWLLDIRTPEEYYAETPENGITVRVGADCTSALERLGDIDESVNPLSVIPEDGIILPLDEISLPEGTTAFDALIEAARASKLRVDYTGSSYGVYVRGIGFVYEFGFGSESGWTYRVNGSAPQMSAGAYELSDGDTVEFIYTGELGYAE
ncbi:MAG: DUF4430 domain-containing protein [Ruminococcaceae bacterium]|nr:DUF4430 domain-containing protein [Oscillospiraceae bacterium]